jgi:ribonuclease HI
MKKLKLDHKFAEMILRGELRSTWRLFDDKDLSVDDNVELIDKVDPADAHTWHVIGVATIHTVIEKRLAEISREEMTNHGGFSSSQEMLTLYREYYGSNVNMDTVVKILSFDFQPHREGDKLTSGEVTHHLKEVKIYADGGSRGNPGPSASGYVVLDMQDAVLVDKGIYLGVTTNNQAEYQALKFALEEAQRMHAQRVEVYMDSLLVVNQMKSIFKVKNRELWPIHNEIKQLVATFQAVSFMHVPRELNKLADAAVNRALDEAMSSTPQKLS